MKVLVTGGTGFTGSHVVPLLLDAGIEVRCLVRPTSRTEGLPRGVETIQGDLGNLPSLVRAMSGTQALVNIASIGFGHGPGIVAAALDAGLRRSLFISTTAIFTSLDARTKTVRLAAERAIRSSTLAWTILRPTMIYGAARDRNISRLVNYLQKCPVIPVFGSGSHLMQPIYVADLAQAVLNALLADQTIGQEYNLPGATPLTFDELIDITARALGRRVWKIHIPSRPIVWWLRFLERFLHQLPIKAEQIQRLEEDKSFDYSTAARDFGFRPITFQDGIMKEILNIATEKIVT